MRKRSSKIFIDQYVKLDHHVMVQVESEAVVDCSQPEDTDDEVNGCSNENISYLPCFGHNTIAWSE